MYHLFVTTPEKIIFDGNVKRLSIPGTWGYFEILTDHTPIISALTTGKVTFTDEQDKKWTWALSGGLFEVTHNEATLLADAIEEASAIDLKRAEVALTKAKKNLETHDQEADVLRAKKAIQRAQNRIKVASESKKT